jgi:CRP/FNR family transcriptional regulator, cyclic AMP receptor protein
MNTKTKIQFFQELNVLLPLNETQMEQLAQASQYRVINRYQFAYMPDEPSEGIFFLVKGRIKLGTFAADGREVIKEIMQPGAVVGELALSGEKTRNEYAQVLHDEAEVLFVRAADFQKLMEQNTGLIYTVMQYLAQRLQRVEERLSRIVLQDARKRIIEFLVESASRDGRKVGYEMLVKHHLTQQDIANLTGTSRQTVTSVFNDLKKLNLIHFNRNSILIRDLERLA